MGQPIRGSRRPTTDRGGWPGCGMGGRRILARLKVLPNAAIHIKTLAANLSGGQVDRRRIHRSFFGILVLSFIVGLERIAVDQ